MKLLLISLLVPFAFAGTPRTPAPKDAKVYFINLKNGAKVKSPVTIQFGLKGMGIAPAGMQKDNTGHHHLLIDTKLANYDVSIPSDDQRKHFGAGQTEVSLSLAPGKHTLQLVLADQNHIPHQPPVQSKVITIYVKK